MKKQTLPLTEVKSGQKVFFNCPGYEATFELVTVTDKRVSWYCGFTHRSGNGKNMMKMTTITRQSFQRGLVSGTYKLI